MARIFQDPFSADSRLDACPCGREHAPGLACTAEAAQAWIGQPATDANVQAAFKATGAKSLRSLKPGDAMTMDYRTDRVNVVQDANGAIEKISCG